MARNHHQQDGIVDDFFEQILAVPPGYGDSNEAGRGDVGSFSTMPMILQLGSSTAAVAGGDGGAAAAVAATGGFRGLSMGMMGLGLNLEHGFLRAVDDSHDSNNAAPSTGRFWTLQSFSNGDQKREEEKP